MSIDRALASLFAFNDEVRSVYRESLRDIQSPALIRMVQAIADQKLKQASGMRSLMAPSFDDTVDFDEPSMVQEPSHDPIGVLDFIIESENLLASSLSSLSAASPDEDRKDQFRLLTDMSVKFASWARDHRDLLSLS